MGFFRFQTKLFLAISLVVTGALVAVHVVTQRKVREVYGRLFEERFTGQIDSFLELQKARLEVAEHWCAEAAESALAAEVLKGRPRREVVEKLKAELMAREFRTGSGEVFRPGGAAGESEKEGIKRPLRPGGGLLERRPLVGKGKEGENAGEGAGGLARLRPTMVALVDGEGELIPILGGVVRENREAGRKRLRELSEAMAGGELSGRQEVGFLAVGEKEPELREVVATPVRDPESGEVLGALVVGLPPAGVAGRKFFDNAEEGERILGGRLFEGNLYSENIPPDEGRQLAGEISKRLDADEHAGSFDTKVDGRPYRVQFRALNPGSALPVAYNVSLFPLAGLHAEQRAMRAQAIGFGAVALVVAFVAAYLMARRISVPIRDLSAGTEKVREGDFAARVEVRSKDELGALAESFNEMADGLAQREKFRNILGMVVDEQVARELVEGALELGGEERVASILFCDIRGFTAMTEGMAPQEVIGFVNAHMTAMTAVVHRHHGVVDKFVGDLIMAVFGVPKAYGDDALNAARCALEMVEERRRLNSEGGTAIEVGIGVATGEVVAGRMGSESRLEYTVLGERVNLASRLCGVAGAGEVVADAETVERAGERLVVVEMAPVSLKGFSDGVVSYRLEGTREIPDEMARGDGRPASA